MHRGDYDRALCDGVLSALRAGSPLLIAPEGGRSHAPGLRQAKPGVAYMAEQSGVPVIPVAIVGTTDDFWQKASTGKRPHLQMHIGKPIQLPPAEGKGAERRESRQRNADLVMRVIAGLLPEDYRGFYAENAILPGATTMISSSGKWIGLAGCTISIRRDRSLLQSTFLTQHCPLTESHPLGYNCHPSLSRENPRRKIRCLVF